jgi:hypothetical protein
MVCSRRGNAETKNPRGDGGQVVGITGFPTPPVASESSTWAMKLPFAG